MFWKRRKIGKSRIPNPESIYFCFWHTFWMKLSTLFVDFSSHSFSFVPFFPENGNCFLYLPELECSFVLQVSEPEEQCEGATQAFHFWHKKARCARQNICIEILACWCLASWCIDYCICLTVISLRKSIGISIIKRDFKDHEDCSYRKCQWLLNCISYF